MASGGSTRKQSTLTRKIEILMQAVILNHWSRLREMNPMRNVIMPKPLRNEICANLD